MPKFITSEHVPTWAIMYLEYGDADGITDEERQTIDAWLAKNCPNGYICEYHPEDSGFTRYPLWGLPCQYETVDFYDPL